MNSLFSDRYRNNQQQQTFLKILLCPLLIAFGLSSISATHMLAASSEPLSLDCAEVCQQQFAELKKYARNGSPHAQTLLALSYRTVDIDNSGESAWKWLNRAKKQSFAAAYYYSSRWHRQGYMTDIDTDKADHLLLRAAELNYAPAQFERGIRMLNQNYSISAISLIQAAIEQDYAPAQRFQDSLQQLNMSLNDQLTLDDSAIEELLGSRQGMLPIRDDMISPEPLFTELVSVIKRQGIYDDPGTTGSHISDIKCGELQSPCQIVRIDDIDLSDSW